MPYLVQKTYWDKEHGHNNVVIKIVRNEEAVGRVREEIVELYKEDASDIYNNYHSGCHEDLQKFCDVIELEELIEEILEEDCSEQMKYMLIIRSIVQSFFCCVRSKEIESWNNDIGDVIMDDEGVDCSW